MAAHLIKVVASRTGLSKDVIRVWESRYSAISPARADSGRRLYTNADIDRLLQLKSATVIGLRISDAAQMPQGGAIYLESFNDIIEPLRTIRSNGKS